MKTGFRFAIYILLCVILAGGSYYMASGLMDNVFQYRSPLNADPPIPGLSLGDPVARQVVFVLIDALRYDTSLKPDVMPALNQLREQAAFAEMHSKTPSYSSPGYGVLLTGAWPELSDAPAFNLNYEDITEISQDNLFSSASRLGLRTAVSGYYWFEKLIPKNAVNTGFYTPDEDNNADRAVLNAALPWVQSADYQLILIHIDQVDYAGHYEGGPRSEDWDAAATRADSLLYEILTKMDLSQDVIFVCSDHGQVDQGGHGGQDAITLVEPFVLAGKGIQPGDYGTVNMVDVAPTLAAILGINIPAAAQGQVLSDMISGLSPEVVNKLPIVTARQQVELIKSYSTSIGVPASESILKVDENKTISEYQKNLKDLRQKRVNRERALRVGGALVLLIIAGYSFLRWKPKDWKQLLLAAVIYTTLFHVFYLVIGPKLYSFSVVKSQVYLIMNNGLAALIVYILVWLLFRRSNNFKNNRLLTAIYGLRLSLILIAVTLIPVIIHLVWNGYNPGWMLPLIGLLYLAIISLVQILFIAVAGLLQAGISFWLVKSKPNEGSV